MQQHCTKLLLLLLLIVLIYLITIITAVVAQIAHGRRVIILNPNEKDATILPSSQTQLVFATEKNHDDLYNVLSNQGYKFPLFSNALDAVTYAKEGAAVVITAQNYPTAGTVIDPKVIAIAAQKKLRLFIECLTNPLPLPLSNAIKVQSYFNVTKWQRGVVTETNFFGPALAPMRIGSMQFCSFIQTHLSPTSSTTTTSSSSAAASTKVQVHMVIARVAGYNYAPYGLPPENETFPLLFEYTDSSSGITFLASTTKLTNFITARYAPSPFWKTVMSTILEWLTSQRFPIEFELPVHPTYSPNERLPDDAEKKAFERASEWYLNSKLLLDEKRIPNITASLAKSIEVGPTPDYTPVANGTLGILEAFATDIVYTGGQLQRIVLRSDCQAESAMGIAMRCLGGECPQEHHTVATNILDFLYFNSIAQGGACANSSDPAFGLVRWYINYAMGVEAFWGDDNARVILGSIAASAALHTHKYDEAILKTLLGNLRTSSREGFRHQCMFLSQFEANGWEFYFNEKFVALWPHYESYLWATFLWAYHHTRFPLFYERAYSAISLTMAGFPHNWNCTNGFSQEMARMLLPLSWLVRVNDTAQHRDWLRTIATALLELQQPCGAIREKLGTPVSQCLLHPPTSNSEYGTAEAPLEQEDGDPVSDLLYTMNFAFLGLHEASYATKEQIYIDAANKVAEFMTRIQASSTLHPELSGGFYRAFDYELWEYWSSSSDESWGSNTIETGWTQGWITAVLGMRVHQTSLWDLASNTKIGAYLDELLPLFFPNSASASASASSSWSPSPPPPPPPPPLNWTDIRV